MATVEGSRIVVLGGSAGIGLATAKLAATRGGDVVIAGRSQARLDATREEIGPCEAYRCDVADEASVAALFAAVGSLDHLVVCAAVPGTGPVVGTPKTTFAPNVDTRIWGQFHTVQHAAPRTRPSGSMTFMSGVSTRKCFPGTSLLGAAQGAVEVFARQMAVELAPIRVNTLRLGVIDTPALDEFLGEDRVAAVAEIGASLPVGRIGRAEEAAELALFVMGCGYMTGSVVCMDGGQLLV